MNHVTCRYCGYSIPVENDSSDMDVINETLTEHEKDCPAAITILNASPAASRKEGRKCISRSDLNPHSHFENAKICIENLLEISKELEEDDLIEHSQNILTKIHLLEGRFAINYRWKP